MKQLQRAFTLIELLVVIAIIAILAAILFPVFAQAKLAAKKTACLSQVKQTGTSLALYTSDNEDNYPQATAVDNGGPCGTGMAGTILDADQWAVTIPAGADNVNCGAIDSQSWVNSVQPYAKNFAITTLTGAPTLNLYSAATLATFTKAPETSSLTFNGLLSTYSGTAIAQPSRTPTLWFGNGNINLRGATYPSNPTLICTMASACRFNPSSMPNGAAGTGLAFNYWGWGDAKDSMWHFGRGSNFASADTSARFLKLNPGGGEYSFSYYDPFGAYQKGTGIADGIVQCATNANSPRYASFFRPDSEFNYKLAFPSSANTTCTQ